jgi:hypothetical protein
MIDKPRFQACPIGSQWSRLRFVSGLAMAGFQSAMCDQEMIFGLLIRKCR